MLRAIVLSIVLLLATHASPGFAASIGKVVAVLGQPTSTGPSGDRTLSAGSEIFEHDKIKVGSGNAQILFIDGTKLVIGPGSTLIVEKYLLRGGASAQDFSINALRGTYRFITGKSPKNAYKIKTANATIGIRGTGFDFWVQASTGVAVHEGRVKLCNSSGSCVNLNAGCELGVAKNSGSEKLNGTPKASVVTSKLPYIVNQNQLRASFRLNIKACAQVSSKGKKKAQFDLDNQGKSRNPQAERPQQPTTPTPPTTPTTPTTPPTPPDPKIP
jgi:hypothetical protein